MDKKVFLIFLKPVIKGLHLTIDGILEQMKSNDPDPKVDTPFEKVIKELDLIIGGLDKIVSLIPF